MHAGYKFASFWNLRKNKIISQINLQKNERPATEKSALIVNDENW